jgi:hypothetical protein
MKRSLLLVAMACLLSIKAHAQWTTSGSDIQNTNVGNVGIGTSTPSSKLDVNGGINLSVGNRITIGAANLINIIGTQNLHLGSSAGAVSSGNNNFFAGFKAGQVNTSGSFNSFVGANSGQANTTGSENLFFGDRTGFSNTVGATNTFIGSRPTQPQ